MEDEDYEYEQEQHDGVSILRGLVRMMNTYFLYPFQKLTVAEIKSIYSSFGAYFENKLFGTSNKC